MGLKVSGVMSVDEAQAALDAGAFAIGLVALEGIPPARLGAGGHLPDDGIREICDHIAEADPRVWATLVTSKRGGAAIADHIHRTHAGAVRIVGACEPRDWVIIRAAHPSVKIIQEIDPGAPDALEIARKADGHVDAILLDCGARGDDAASLCADWRSGRNIAASVATPIIVSGGLRPDNVDAAVEAVRPEGVAATIRLGAGKSSKGALTSLELITLRERFAAAYYRTEENAVLHAAQESSLAGDFPDGSDNGAMTPASTTPRDAEDA
ncbi:MAG: hypothetical protein AAFX08_09765 [Pseudomonadota bacterium]